MLAEDVKNDRLPAVSWVLPPKEWSEHPSASTPIEGAAFTSRVLDALTANPQVWASTVLFVTFDENDGLFDHVPPPAPPTLAHDGTPQGKSTLDLSGHYFDDRERRHLDPRDTASGAVRPWAMGPRVPMYVISPWSRGGFVSSEVFDHTSVGRFLEKRFGITVPAISPWHRAVSGDLTSAFDFGAGPDTSVPELPDVSDANATLLTHLQRARLEPPATPTPAVQEPGTRRSRAVPYVLHVLPVCEPARGRIRLEFVNAGAAGAVLHVYDRLRLDALPRRYTVQAGRKLEDLWALTEDGRFDVYVMGPNGFLRHFAGRATGSELPPSLATRYEAAGPLLNIERRGGRGAAARLNSEVYAPQGRFELRDRTSWSAAQSGGWYDLTVTGAQFEYRFAGRIETGGTSTSDPAGRS
jgi:phospholipase C